MGCTSRFPASSRTTSHPQGQRLSIPCTPPCSAPSPRPWKCRFRTQDMHKIAEAGVASHWLYKTAESLGQGRAEKDHQWLQSCWKSRAKAATPSSLGAHQGRPVSGRGVCVHAQGQDHGLAARRDRGRRFGLQRAYRHRQPLHCGQDQQRACIPLRTSCAMATGWKSSPRRMPTPIRLAELCGDRQARAQTFGTI